MLMTTAKNNTLKVQEAITANIMPIGEPIKAYTGVSSAGEAKVANAVITKETICTNKCCSVLTCFGIDDSIYQSFVSRYSGQSLSFPTQILSFHQMDGRMSAPDNLGGAFNLAFTITPRFIDTFFIFFPLNSKHKTTYFNPVLDEARLYMSGYGAMTDQSMSSYSIMAYEMIQNALKMNNDLMGFNKGVMRSQIIHPKEKKKNNF